MLRFKLEVRSPFMETKKIIVERRSDDCVAFLEGHRESCGFGESIASAVGSLISAHRDLFSIEIEIL